MRVAQMVRRQPLPGLRQGNAKVVARLHERCSNPSRLPVSFVEQRLDRALVFREPLELVEEILDLRADQAAIEQVLIEDIDQDVENGAGEWLRQCVLVAPAGRKSDSLRSLLAIRICVCGDSSAKRFSSLKV